MLKTPSVPAAFFGIVLGLVGLGGCWREASVSGMRRRWSESR